MVSQTSLGVYPVYALVRPSLERRETYEREILSNAAMYSCMHWVRQRSSPPESEVLGRVTHLAKHWGLAYHTDLTANEDGVLR